MHLRFLLPADDATALERMVTSRAFRYATGEVDEYGRIRVRYRGLRIDYWPINNKGRVRGSLHTFALGHNRGRFSADMIAMACATLAAELGLSAHTLQVYKLEIGVNIPTPDSPNAFLDTLLQHKQCKFYPVEPPRNCSRPLLFVATHLDYRVKLYNKGQYDRSKGEMVAAEQRHLLRFEVVFTRGRPLYKLVQRDQLTLADLPDPALLGLFAAHLRTHWCLSKRQEAQDLTGLRIQDALLLHARNEVDLWQQARHTTPSRTLRHHRQRCEQLQEEMRQRLGPHPYEALFHLHLDQLLPTSKPSG